MSKLKRILCVALFLLLVGGCLDTSDTVLSDPSDRVLPLAEGRYFVMASIEEAASKLSAEEKKKYLTPSEQILIQSSLYAPDEAGKLVKSGSCYVSGEEKSDSDSRSYYMFENIAKNVYLFAIASAKKSERPLAQCPAKDEKLSTFYLLVKIDNNIIYKQDGPLNAEFQKWLETLSGLQLWRYDITKDKEGKFAFSSTRAYKEFVVEHLDSFKFDIPFIVFDKQVAKYADNANLLVKIKSIRDKIKADKERKAAELKRREEQEKNGGQILWAFGKRLGDASPVGKFEDIVYRNITGEVEKSPFFDEYYELALPLSKKVFSIYGISGCMDAKTCRQKAEKIMSILGAKYGSNNISIPSHPRFFSKGSIKSLLFLKRIEKSGNLVEVICMTDGGTIKAKNKELKLCNLNENLWDLPITSGFDVSKNSLYYRYHPKGYDSYGSSIVPIWAPNRYLYPAPLPSLSKSYNKYYKKCGLDRKNDIFRLFIRYSDKSLEAQIDGERKTIRRQKKLNSPDAEGL